MVPKHISLIVALSLTTCVFAAESTVEFRANVADADTGKALACRVYLRSAGGEWHFVKSADPQGSAVQYKKQNWNNKESVEMHTTVSAHPFIADLAAGDYTITVERGKEYFTATREFHVDNKPVKLTIPLKRWIDMARLGWYSGDTHVHRTLAELPNVQTAEDLNVSFPLLYWVTKAFAPPAAGDKSTKQTIKPELIAIDDTHVIYPVNTEYEIFSVGGKRHTLGAVFILNHKSPFQIGAPPVGPIAKLAKQQGGLLELDKHNWPWSMMLVPVMNVDLFELTNNHIWRTQFAFTNFGEKPAAYMKIETTDKGFDERGWIDYGFENYYALLNCGFRMRPTAGTASGVHPVPLGFGRVYVKVDGGFDYDKWIKGLDEGRSFVTTGPMLLVTVNDHQPGHTFAQSAGAPLTCTIKGHVNSARPLAQIEVIVNGRIARTVKPENTKTKSGACISRIDEKLSIDSSSWIAVRCFETDKGRVRFAHTGPFHVDVESKPLRPAKEQINFLIERMEAQIKHNENTLPKPAMDEYREALNIYREIAKTAK